MIIFATILIKILLYADQIFRNRRGQKPPHYALRLRYFERFGLKIRRLNSIERSPMLDLQHDDIHKVTLNQFIIPY